MDKATSPAAMTGERTDFDRFGDGGSLGERYASADPFPHIVLDGRFPESLLLDVIREIESDNIDPEGDFYGSFQKHRISDVRRMKPRTRSLIEDLNSAPFIEFLEHVTGISGLVPDPHLEGGGIHQIGPGGYLKVHTDFNWHRRLSLHRRINVLLYLNPEWKSEWNGQLELWDEQMSECRVRVDPLLNRMVIFSTTDRSYHGHPDPLACPEHVNRNSVATYYYSADRPAGETRFGTSQLTNYRIRPNERFRGGKMKHRLHQLLIKRPLLRKLLRDH